MKKLLAGTLLLTLLVWSAVGGVLLLDIGANTHAAGVSSHSDTAAASTQPANEPCDFTELYDATISSVVTVRVTRSDQPGQGSGFVYDSNGRIVTNQHVVGDASTVEVQFNRGEWRTAEVIGTDAFSDLAVLEVDDVPDYADPLSLAGGFAEPGQPVAALGSPVGLSGSISQGIVSGTDRSMPTELGYTIPNAIQTDAATNPGNSGGPLVTCAGLVVGVNRAAGGENIGFAISASMVETIVPSLIETGTYRHASLGISSVELSPLLTEANGLDTTDSLLVLRVAPGGPASGALRESSSTTTVDGIQVPTGGDVLLSIAGQELDTQEDLASYLAEEARPGETVELIIIRDGERRTVSVTLVERPMP